MSISTLHLRQRLIEIEKRDVGKLEESKNQAPWIRKYWSSTTYPDGYKNREPYCAAAQAYCQMRWLSDEEVLAAFKMTPAQAEKWRCKSPAVKDWVQWAKDKKLQMLPRSCILHAADLVVYTHSHIELVVDDDNTATGPFVTIGMNTSPFGSRDGEGCYRKPRQRFNVKYFIRVLQ